MGGAVYVTPQEELDQYVQDDLDAVIAGLPDDIKADSVRLAGDPADQLGERSESLDLMLAGSRGYGPLRSVLVGGVSGRLMHTVHCPVIIVPRGVQTPLAMLFPSQAVAALSTLMEMCSVVPASGADSIFNVPGRAPSARGCRATRNRPSFPEVESLAVVAHRHIDGAVTVADPDVHAGASPCLTVLVRASCTTR